MATWGLAYEAELAVATHAALETFGASGERAGWQLAVRHDLVPDRLQIDASAGSALGRWQENRTVTIGLVWAGPAFQR